VPNFQLTEQAKDDVRDIVAYVRGRSPSGAKLVRQKLRAAMSQLAEFPGIGHRRDDVTDEPVRFWAVYSYLIVYRHETRPLQVIAVLHGDRELPGEIKRRTGK
jgi:toxin ParE1/3/4